MKKETKKKMFIAGLLILVVVVGFGIKRVVGNQLTTSKEKPKEEESSKVEYSKNTEDPKPNKKTKPVEPSSNEATDADKEEELEEIEEISMQEEKPKEEEVLTETEETATSLKEEPVEKTESTTNQEAPQNLSKPTEPKVAVEPAQVVEKSNVGMSEYLLPFSNSEERVEKTTHVVLHFTSNALNNPQNPYLIEDTYNIFKDYGVSAHYVIGRGGEIYLFVPENRVAYHAGRGQLKDFPEYGGQLNHYSIGIELLAIGTREEMIPVISAEKFDLVDPAITGYTEAQYQSLNTLLNDIVARYPHIQKNRNHIVGHDEYSAEKTDPGRLFNWSKIGL